MTSAQRLPEVTFEEYLHSELADDQRCEWVGGEVYAMSGGSERHDLLTGLLYRVLAPAAEARGCRAFQQNRKVKLQDAAYYPDVLVVCPSGSRPDRLFERDLTIVVEVLSPPTERIDRVEKASAYAGAPSFEVYVVADPERRRIEVGRRDGGRQLRWEVYDGADRVPLLPADGDAGSVIDLQDLYDRLDATAVAD